MVLEIVWMSYRRVTKRPQYPFLNMPKQLLEVVKQNIQKAQARQKKQYDRKHLQTRDIQSWLNGPEQKLF